MNLRILIKNLLLLDIFNLFSTFENMKVIIFILIFILVRCNGSFKYVCANKIIMTLIFFIIDNFKDLIDSV